MKKAKKMLTLAAIKAENGMREVAKKLRDKVGISEFVAVLIMVVAAVVIGGALLALSKTTMDEVWQTVATRIKDLFNYK